MPIYDRIPRRQQRIERAKASARYRRRVLLEPLESRALMFGDAASIPTTLIPTWQYAWDHAADLSQYSPAQLNQVGEWAVRFDQDHAVNTPLDGLLTAVVGIPDAYVWQQPETILASEAAALLSAREDVISFYPLIAVQQIPRTLPNDSMIGQQWHLKNTGQTGGLPGEDANVEPVWDAGIQGNGVVIGIVDDGLQYTHPDLASNYVAPHSYDFNFNDSDPAPTSADAHGTSAAGVAAARGNNGLGVAGSAYNASLAGLRLIAAGTSDSQEANALSYHNQDIDIYSNSWGPADDGYTLEAPGALTLAAFQNSVTTGRGGLGSIYVWAAGNGLESNDNANYDGYASSRYVIGVSAVGHGGTQSYYSEPGASILVAGYSNEPGIVTTDLLGFDGYSSTDYTTSFGGTSSATPLVAGVVALMLQANPNLTWRDVREVIARSASKNNAIDSGWTLNGGGHDVNHKYGFGAIDAAAAVTLAQNWNTVSAEVSYSSAVQTVNTTIPDINFTGVTSTINVPAASSIRVESVEVVFNAFHSWRGDLEVVLTSPSGTQSILAQLHNDDGDNYSSWVFSSSRHLDELSAGNWTLTVRDLDAGISGTFQNWTLRLYGTPGGYDFGDLPASYELTAAAKHGQLTSLGLGATKDTEGTASAPLNGTGDGADEDGVSLPTLINTTGGIYYYVANVVGGVGKLDAWIDFNGDGDFGDAGENIASGVSLGTGSHSLSFTAPSGITASSLNSRFRLSTAGGLSFIGAALDGEVEDYVIPIASPGATLTAVVVGNQLTITDSFVTGRDNNLSVSRSGNFLTIADTNEQFIAAPVGGVLSNSDKTLTIDLTQTPVDNLSVVTAGGNDYLTLSLAGDNPIPTGGLSYDGGSSTLDRIIISGGGNQGTVGVNLTGASSGSLTLANFGTLTVAGTEFISNQGQGIDLNLGLPPIANNVTLADDGVSGNGRSRLTAGTIPQVDFADPTGIVTLLRGTAGDAVFVNSAPDLDADVALGVPGSPFATVTIAGVVGLTAGNYFTVNANSVVFSAAANLSTTGTGGITLAADSLDVNASATISTTVAGTITLQTAISGRTINVGGADSGTELGTTDAELDRLTSGTIQIGSAGSGAVRVTANITRPAGSTAGMLFKAGNGFATQFPATFTDLSLASGYVAFAAGSDAQFAINGSTAGTQYEQLVVTGGVRLTGTDLVFSGSYQPGASDSFTLIDNDGTDAIEGIFTGLPEGSLLTVNGGVSTMRISYTGGTGNDVVLLPANVSIGGRVWRDANSNGLEDVGETGVAEAVAELFNNLGVSQGIRITDAAGNYVFNVGPGSYFVEFRLPSGFAFTTANVGANDSIDSDPATTTGRTSTFSVTANSTNLNWDAGTTRGMPAFGWVTPDGASGGAFSGNSVVRDANDVIYNGGYQTISGLGKQGVITTQTSVGARIRRVAFTNSFDGSSSVAQIALAPNGDILAVGTFRGTVDFDPSSAVSSLVSNSSVYDDAFVVRLSSEGRFIWARQFSGYGPKNDINVAVDSLGNAYTSLTFSGTVDIDPGPAVDNRTTMFSNNFLLVERFDAAGNRIWANVYGATSEDVYGHDIVVSPLGNLIIGGNTGSYFVDFDPGAGTSLVPNQSVYVARVNIDGSFISIAYATYWGQFSGLAVGADDSVVATGYGGYNGDFDPGPGVYSISGDAFAWKLDSANALQWAFALDGATGTVYLSDVDLDPAGNVYVTGMHNGFTDFDPGPSQHTHFAFESDGFVAQYSPAGAYVSAMFLVPTTTFYLNLVQINALLTGPNVGDVLLTGGFQETVDFDPGATQYNLTNANFYSASFLGSYHLPYNSLPTINIVPSTSTTLEDTTSAAIFFSIGDFETDLDQLTLSATSDNPTLFPAGSFAFTSAGGGNRNLFVTPAANMFGFGTITVTVTDAGGLTATDTVLFGVSPVNDPPSFTVGTDQTVLMNAGRVSVPNWVTARSTGPTNEATQTLVFYVVDNSNAGLFLVQPLVFPDGTLTFEPMPNVTGTATITLRAQDNGGVTNGGVDVSPRQSFVITVNPSVSPPNITDVSDQSILEEGSVPPVNFTIGDAETAATALTVFVTSSNAALLPVGNIVLGGSDENRTIAMSPVANQFGTSTVVIYVRDESGETAADTLLFTVDPVNDVPSFTKGADENIYFTTTSARTIPNWAAAISKGPANEASQALTFQIVGNTNPAFFAVAPAISSTGTLTYTKAVGAAGSVTLSVQLVDAGGIANGGVDTSAVQTFTINVDPDIVAPTITSSPGNQTINEDMGTTTLAFTIGDDVTAATSLVVTATSSNTAVIPNSSILLGGAGNSRTILVFPPSNNFGGPVTITVTVRDAAFNTSQFSFDVTLLSVNDRPTFTKGSNVSLNEDAGASSLTAWATSISRGPANESVQGLTFNTTVTAGASLFSLLPAIDTTTGTLTFTPAANAFGTANVSVTLSDDGGTANGGFDTSVVQTFTITLNAVNDVPVFTKGADVSVNEDAGAQSLAGWATGISAGAANESAQILTFGVSSTNSTLFAVLPAISSAGTLTFTPAANQFGTSTVTVTLADDGGTANGGVSTSASQTFIITVNSVNDRPTFTAGSNLTVNEDAGSQFVSWASSPNAGASNESSQSLAYVVTNNTNPSLFNVLPTINSSGSLQYTPTANASGTATITVVLTDNGGLANGGIDTSIPVVFTITVNSVNDRPTFTKGSDLTVLEDAAPQTFTNWATAISAGASNESGQTLTFNISNFTAANYAVPPTIDPITGTLTFTLAPNANGSDFILLTLSDNGGTANGGLNTTSAQFFQLTITAVNDPPLITPSNFASNEDQSIFSFWTTATAGPTNESNSLTFTVTNNSNPALFSSQPSIGSSGYLSYTPATNANGTATITAVLTDSGGTANGGINSTGPFSFDIIINPVNDRPTFTTGSSPTVNEDAGPQTLANWATAINAGAPNENGQILQFNIISNTNAALFSVPPAIASNGTLTYTPAANSSGSASISITLSDDGGTANGGINTSTTRTFSITVNSANDVPSFTAGGDQTVLNNAGPQSVTGWATAISTGPSNEVGQTLTFNVTGNTNSGLFTTQPTVAADGTLTYTPVAGAYGTATITVNLQDNGGTANGGVNTSAAQTFSIFVDSPTPIVTALTPNPSGVQVRLSKPLNTGVLNLSDANNVLGPTDVTLVGATSGNIRGSLVLDSDGRGFTFIKSGGPLAADSYTVTLRSSANGISTPTSELLDGNNDGTTGDNYIQSFVVGIPPANVVTVAVGDFIRGYGQAVNLPANTALGIPITLSSGLNVAGANVVLTYDPALLTITGGSSPLAGVTSSVDTSIPGQVTIIVTSATQFSTGSGVTLANLTANVPATATYAAKHILNLTVQSLTDISAAAIPSIADDGLHVASYRGDLNGSQSINTGDATLALRLQSGVLSTTGFTALQLVDPYFAADMNDDGTATTGDITGILRFLSGASGGFPRIPALPTGLTPPPTFAADPQIFIPTAGLSGRAGDVVTVPVKINVTDPNGIDLAGLSVALNYDAKNFTLTNVRLADSLAGMGASYSTATPGLARFVAVRDVGPHLDHGFVGDLFLFDLTINANAIPGRFAIDLLAESAATDNNAQNLLIAPSILNGPDVNDGLISIIDSNAPRHNTAFAADVDDDGSVSIKDILLTIFYFNQSRFTNSVTTPLSNTSRTYADIIPDSILDIRDVLASILAFNEALLALKKPTPAKSDSSTSTVAPNAEIPLVDMALLSLLASDEGLLKKK